MRINNRGKEAYPVLPAHCNIHTLVMIKPRQFHREQDVACKCLLLQKDLIEIQVEKDASDSD